MTTELQQSLLDKGYRYHQSESYTIFHSTEHLYQKRIRDEKGTQYFIDIWYYPEQTINGHHMNEGILIQSELYSRDEDSDSVVKVQPSMNDIDMAEDLIHNLWEFLGGGYYERNC